MLCSLLCFRHWGPSLSEKHSELRLQLKRKLKSAQRHLCCFFPDDSIYSFLDHFWIPGPIWLYQHNYHNLNKNLQTRSQISARYFLLLWPSNNSKKQTGTPLCPPKSLTNAVLCASHFALQHITIMGQMSVKLKTSSICLHDATQLIWSPPDKSLYFSF